MKTEKEIAALVAEDARRRGLRPADYDPLVGNSDDKGRVRVDSPEPGIPVAYVPRGMIDDPAYSAACGNATAWRRLRIRHDFEYWCAAAVTVKHKTLGSDVRLRLNAPQRRVTAILEADRLAGKPIRLIMLKARQWGGSTLVQVYMAWLQLVHCHNWHSIICAQVKDTSAGIRGMYSKLLDNYPADLLPDDEGYKLRPYERSSNVREISGRGCRVTVSSIENQDAARGADFAMAHLSETAYWRASPSHSPEDVIRAICGSIALLPNTLVAMESTANGVGNYFHKEWERCEQGRGDKHAVFVPWYEIEIYRLEPYDAAAFVDEMDEYEEALWDMGLCLDQIHWYHCKRREYPDHEQMMAEFPTTPEEAFVSTSSGVFSRAGVEALRAHCREGVRGDLGADNQWHASAEGPMLMWQLPDRRGSYVAAVDIGGRTAGTDWSVITVVRNDGGRTEVVAQWRGHIDHDLLAERAEAIARWYNRALLAVESNSLEGGSSGQRDYILERIDEKYPNLYHRPAEDENSEGLPGFHTNRATKDKIITHMIGLVRSGGYIERDTMACDEMLTYEMLPDGRTGAKPGCHDDIVMSRAIALYLAHVHRPVRVEIKRPGYNFAL